MDVQLTDEEKYLEELSEEYIMDGIVKFRIRAVISEKQQQVKNGSWGRFSHIWLFVKCEKILKTASLYISLSCSSLNVDNKCIMADSEWHLVTDEYATELYFSINFTVEVKSNSDDKLKVFYDDEQTDFELRGDDGSVRVHKCILAATSPVFKTMLQGDLKETNNGYIHLQGMTKDILQDFKTFIYFNTLPATVSEQILLIAMLYGVQDMETICIINLVQNMTAESLIHLLKFATTHNDKLIEAILECLQYGFIRVDEIRKHRVNDKGNETSQDVRADD